MTALADALARHVGQHRLTLTAPDKLRCLDCQQTIDLRPALTAVPSHTSTSRGHPRADQSCAHHPGQWPGTCGPCRAEQLERSAQPAPFQPAANVPAGIAAAPPALPARKHPPHPGPCTRSVDGDGEPLDYCNICYRYMAPQVGQERATRPVDSLPSTDGPDVSRPT